LKIRHLSPNYGLISIFEKYAVAPLLVLQPLVDMPHRKKAAIHVQNQRVATTSHFGKPAIEVDMLDADYCTDPSIGKGSNVLIAVEEHSRKGVKWGDQWEDENLEEW
jgi:hypothetical protein